MSFDFSEFTQAANRVITHFTLDLSSLRTGRATVQLLDPVSVEAYGTQMKVSEVASITVPEPSMLLISPWDKSLLAAIERGINEAQLNVNPVVDGQIIRITIPPLTQERREQMVKLLHQKLEGARAMLRSVRADTKRDLEKQKGQPGVSEDMIEADLKTLDTKAKDYETQLETLGQRKEAELMTI